MWHFSRYGDKTRQETRIHKRVFQPGEGQVRKPGGKTVLGKLEDHQRGRCGWSKVERGGSRLRGEVHREQGKHSRASLTAGALAWVSVTSTVPLSFRFSFERPVSMWVGLTLWSIIIWPYDLEDNILNVDESVQLYFRFLRRFPFSVFASRRIWNILHRFF